MVNVTLIPPKIKSSKRKGRLTNYGPSPSVYYVTPRFVRLVPLSGGQLQVYATVIYRNEESSVLFAFVVYASKFQIA